MNKFLERDLMRVIKERDNLRGEIEKLKSELIMYRPHDAKYRVPLKDMFDNLVIEYQKLKEMYAEAIYTIEVIRKDRR